LRSTEASRRCTNKLCVASACFKRLQLTHDEPISDFAYNLKLRRYSQGSAHEFVRVMREALESEAGAYTRPLFGST
jgi:hypothetical protein